MWASLSISLGSSLVVRTRGASIRPPLLSGRNVLEKFSSPSMASMTQSSSPSQFLLLAAWKNGCP